MSLNRLIFYSAMIGGWAAFVGWLISETLLIRRSVPEGWWGFLVILLTGALVGGCIAGGLTLLGGVASGSFKGQLHRFLPGFLGGLIGGAVGSMLGNSIYLVINHWFVLLLGWTVMGLAIGAVEGIYDRSSKKLRNGLIGGGVGGLLGGILFSLLGASSMSDRATGFVILGMCIGCFIGLAQVMLKEAWLTVEAGFRPGRQLVLSMPEIIMGTSEKAALPFIAFGAKGVEPVHLRILRRDDGSYLIEDNKSRTGTFVNGQQVQGALVLRNEDVIQLGVNLVRFREAHRHQAAIAVVAAPAPAPAAPSPGPTVAVAAGPPPVPKAVAPIAAQPAVPRSTPQYQPSRPNASSPAAPTTKPPLAKAPPGTAPGPRPGLLPRRVPRPHRRPCPLPRREPRDARSVAG